MAVDGFMRYPEVPGESLREGHEDEIELHDVRFAMSSPAGSTGGGRTGRPTLEPVVVGKRYDRSSPALKQHLAQGRRVPAVTITLSRTTAEELDDYLVITLQDARLTSYEMATTEDGVVEESLALDYRTIRFVYRGTHEVEIGAR